VKSTNPLPAQLSTGRKYKRFSIPALPREVTDARSNTQFFYVGDDFLKIDSLISTFKNGYAVDHAQKAIPSLKQLADRGQIPDVIIVDAALGEDQLKQLSHFVSGDDILKRIPFMLEASEISKTQLKVFTAMEFLDEVIFLDRLDQRKLMAKIHFLQKVKSRLAVQPVKQPKHLYVPGFDNRILTKRVFDLFFAVVGVLILSPLFILIALLIKLESPGPVLYVSKRAGRGYRVFDFYKFRTMVMGADKNIQQLSHLNHYTSIFKDPPVFFKVINDTRTTRIGAFLRNTSLDELPQFFNVLLGDMSLVGNRPLPLYEAAKLTTDEWAERFMAPAGMTGLWQINKKGREKTTMEDRINLDITYSNKYNFIYDLWIIVNTPFALIQRTNA
jgi:lipopolysaccharide/colanic/teichoic acid biosynthesis glycosyltransferase